MRKLFEFQLGVVVAANTLDEANSLVLKAAEPLYDLDYSHDNCIEYVGEWAFNGTPKERS